MARLTILVIVFLTILTGLSVHASSADCPKEPVVNGVGDLRCWDGKSNISLSGQWLFDYQALGQDKTFHGTAYIPLRWREMEPALPFAGRGVYRFKLLLSEPVDDLGLKLSANYTARKVVLIDAAGNEKILFDTGKTELSEQTIVNMRTPIIYIPKLGVESELILYVNNTETINAGVEVAPIIGPVDDFVRHDQILRNTATIISAVFLVFFIINIYLWWVRDKDWSLFSLALMTLIIALRQVAASGFLYDFFPKLSTGFDGALGWGTFFSGLITGMLFFRATYPNITPKWLAKMVYVVGVLGFGILISQPYYVTQVYGGYINIFTFIALIILLGYFINRLRRLDEELRLTLISCAALLCGFAADVIYYRLVGFNPVIPLVAIGMLIFVVTQSIIISRRYSQSLRRLAELSKELQASNANLEEKVEKRTAELASKNQQLEEMARTDALTKLSNRRAFDELIRHEIGRSERSGQSFVIGIVDLDRFKTVNDTYGHDAGDLVLQAVAKTLQDGLRAGDFPFRWGGDEFCILFPETAGDVALVIAERLKQMIETQVFSINDKALQVTASFGLAVWQADLKVSDVIKHADHAMYESKRLGSNKVTAWWHMSKTSPNHSE